MKKRIISSIMCLAMLLSLLPVTAFAVEGEGETLESATGIDVTEAGAFTSGNNLMTYINGTYYLNEGDGITDAADNTAFVHLSKAIPTGYKLYIQARKADTTQNKYVNVGNGAWYIDAPKSFAYFAHEYFANTSVDFRIRVGLYQGTINSAADIYWYMGDSSWEKTTQNGKAPKTFDFKSVSTKVAAPGTITLTETGLTDSAKSQIAWTNATSAESGSGITAKIGAPVSFTVEAPEGYTVKSVTVGGEAVTAKDGKYSFVMADKTAAVAVTYEAEVVSDTPVLSNAGFDMDAAKAHTEINRILKLVRPGADENAVPSSDVDTNTMYVAVDNLDSAKTYELVVTKGTTSIYTEELSGKADTVFYFTFNPGGGSHTEEVISEGVYKFALSEVSGETKTPVGNTVSLELVKATFVAENAVPAFTADPLYAVKGGEVKLPAVTPVRDGYTFMGWSDGTTTAAANENMTLNDNGTLNAVWKNNNVETKSTAPVISENITNEEIKTALSQTVSGSSADPAGLLMDAELAAETDRIATEATLPSTGYDGYDGVKVVVFLQVDVEDYTPAANGGAATLELNITPKYQLVATKTGDSQDTKEIGTAQNLETTEFAETATISVKLPAGFATSTDTVVAKHWNDGKTAVIEWLPTETADSNVTVTFKPSSFSPYELTVENAKVNLTFAKVDDTPIVAARDYTVLDINSALPTVEVADNKEFKGWAYEKAATTPDITATTMTEELFRALVTKAEGQNLTLYAIIGEKTTPPPSGGSSGGSSTSVSIPSTSNGKVTVSNNNAKKGDTVTITLTPNTGYVVDTVTVTDSKGNTVTVSKTDDTHYTFTMPEGRVTVKATFKQADAPSSTGFTDVAADAYYADAVKWAVEKGITNGLTATTFGPNNSCTRGQMVTFLWRAAGSPAATATNSFTDVASGEYYYDAVLWAVEKGITNGTSATTFSPNATVNRGQTVTFLYRYAESPAATGETSFTDVAADAYYTNAVKWAVAEEITNGTSSTTFSPASNCTRGQIVTFLYRQIAE